MQEQDTAGEVIIEARNAVKHFPVKTGLLSNRTVGTVRAVDDVSFSILENQTFALVGESGCGKTTMANLILKLLDLSSGDILFRGNSLEGMAAQEVKDYRRRVQAVLQDPYGALNPRDAHWAYNRRTAGGAWLRQGGAGGAGGGGAAVGGLARVGAVAVSPRVQRRAAAAHRGGPRALTLNPDLIVLDEPVSSLDVSIRSQVLNLLKDIQDERGISYILISHDLASVEHMSHVIGVMYLGKLVEMGDAELTCSEPLHPYTASLVGGGPLRPGRRPAGRFPSWERCRARWKRPSGCSFHPRCPYAMPICSQEPPPLLPTDDGRMVSCHLYPDQDQEHRQAGAGNRV